MAADKRVTRAVYAAFIAAAAAFIVASVYNIASQVFGGGVATATVSQPCAQAVTTLVAAIDRARIAAASTTNETDAEKKYAEGKSPEWDSPRLGEISRACDADPNGLAALAAVGRLDRAAEAWVHRRTAELGPVRREVDSFIR